MITVTFSPQTLHQHALVEDFIAIYSRPTPETRTEEPAAVTVSVATPEATQQANPEPVPTLEELRAQLMALPRSTALDLLKAFGVGKLPALPVEKYAEFKSAMQARA